MKIARELLEAIENYLNRKDPKKHISFSSRGFSTFNWRVRIEDGFICSYKKKKASEKSRSCFRTTPYDVIEKNSFIEKFGNKKAS